MDLRQIENIIAIEQEQSISRAAEKLFLTQSALNQQLLKLQDLPDLPRKISEYPVPHPRRTCKKDGTARIAK